jgi:hypothetical protein
MCGKWNIAKGEAGSFVEILNCLSSLRGADTSYALGFLVNEPNPSVCPLAY